MKILNVCEDWRKGSGMNKQNKNMVKLVVRGQTTKLGNIVYDYGNKLLIASLGTKASFFMFWYQSSETIVGIAFNLFAGVLADRVNRKKILVFTDVLACLSTFVVFLLFDESNVWLFITVNILLAILGTFNGPAYNAIVKELLEKETIYQYNSYSKTISELMNVLAPIAGILIINVFGFKYGMLINSMSFLLSAFLEWRFEIIHELPKSDKSGNYFNSMKEGFYYISKNKSLLVVLLSSSLTNFFLAGYNFYLPFSNQFANFDSMFAYILVAESIGSVVGATINGISKKDLPIETYCHLLLGVGVSLFIVGFITNKWIILILFGFTSAFLSVFNIQMMSGVQGNTHSDYLGRVFSVIFTASLIFMPIGTLVFSLIKIRSWIVFSIIGMGNLIIYIMMCLLLRTQKQP